MVADQLSPRFTTGCQGATADCSTPARLRQRGTVAMPMASPPRENNVEDSPPHRERQDMNCNVRRSGNAFDTRSHAKKEC
jgi:hypothetical protein